MSNATPSLTLATTTEADIEQTAELEQDASQDQVHSTDPSPKIFVRARLRAEADASPFAGSVTPQEAWALFSRNAVVLVDVRSTEERKFVGHVPGTLHLPWATGLNLNKNPRFVSELAIKVKKAQPVLFLCRSGKRSAQAAEAATRAGFSAAFNVLEGFEGDLDDHQQRGASNGWRHRKLPWVQD